MQTWKNLPPLRSPPCPPFCGNCQRTPSPWNLAPCMTDNTSLCTQEINSHPPHEPLPIPNNAPLRPPHSRPDLL